jgi:hypothetical protein
MLRHVALREGRVDSRDLDEAILCTMVYADLFDYPLTDVEIHRYLIGCPVSASAVEDRLTHLDGLQKRVGFISPYWFLNGREQLVRLRQEREAFAKELWPAARRYGRQIAAIPFVRMVALTGALAMNNATSLHDDIDYLIITQNGRVWLARGLIALLVRLVQRRGVTLCPNYILSEPTLELGEPSLFTAHELVQMVLLHGSRPYQRLLDSNAWVANFLPNASPGRPEHTAEGLIATLGRRSSEALLGGRLGDALEHWERERKIPRLRLEAVRQGASGAIFTPDQCKGHMADHAAIVSRQYTALLSEQGL